MLCHEELAKEIPLNREYRQRSLLRSQNIHSETRRDAGMSRSLHTLVEEISFPLVKTIPPLSAQPFKAVHAVSAVNAPVEGCHIQDNDREQYEEKCHDMPSFDPYVPSC